MQKNYKDPELQTYQKQFNQAVNKRQWSMVREQLVPRVMPPLVVGSAFASTLFLNIWEHLPPQGRMVGVLAFAGAALASPFLNKAGSPVIRRQDAIRAIDKDIGDKDDIPAREFNDIQSKHSTNANNPLWEAGKKQIWEKWGDTLTDQKRRTGFGAYYGRDNKSRTAVHLAAAFTAACLFVPFGNNLDQKWQTALDWTVPLPPLVYHASITPPDNIEGVRVYTDMMLKSAIKDGTVISPHESSTMSVITYDRPANVTVNGNEIKPLPPEEARERRSYDENSYIYEVKLNTDIQSVSVDEYSMTLDIKPDNAPHVTINGAKADRENPTNLELDYSISDDHGATGADAHIGIRDKEGQIRAPILESNKLPTLTLPYE